MPEGTIEIACEDWLAGLGHVDGRLSITSLRHLGIDRLGPEGCPLIAPWFGRLNHHGYDVLGRTVTLDPNDPWLDHDEDGRPLHGVRTSASDWHVEQTGVSSATAVTSAFDGPSFPFPHQLRVSLRLSETGLSVTTELIASSNGPVPVGFGWHPYLVAGDDPVDGWRLELPFVEQVVLDQLLPVGTTMAADPGPDRLRPRDDCFVVGAGAVVRVAGPRTTTTLTFVEGFGWAMVWSPVDATFACVEPMAGPLLALSDHSPGPVVPAGHRHSATFTLA